MMFSDPSLSQQMSSQFSSTKKDSWLFYFFCMTSIVCVVLGIGEYFGWLSLPGDGRSYLWIGGGVTLFLSYFMGKFLWGSFRLYFIYFIGLRYLKKRFTSYVAILGVAVGVMVLVIVLSVMGGFQQAFWEKLRSSSGDLAIESMGYFGVYEHEYLQKELEKIDGITNSAPYIKTIVLIESAGVDYGFLKGINLEEEKKMGKFSSYLLSPRATYLNLYDYKKIPTLKKISASFAKLSQKLKSYKINVQEKNLPEDFPESWPPKLQIAFNQYWSLRKSKNVLENLSDKLSFTHTISNLPGVIVGIELFKRFDLRLGNTITLTTVSGMALDGMQEATRKKIKTTEKDFEIVGTVKVGIYSQDRRSLFSTIEAVQEFIGVEGRVSGINLGCANFKSATKMKLEVRLKLQQLETSSPLFVKTWQEKNITLFRAVQMEKVLLSILLSFIILVAGFMIFAILSMMVVEKTKDIGIIKALGSPSGSIMSVFLFQGILIGVSGIFLGLTSGLLISKYINEIADTIHLWTGWHPFPPKIYYLDRIPISIDIHAILTICVLTFLVSFAVAAVPAFRASRFNAIQALRYE